MKVIGRICFTYHLEDFNKNQHIFTDTLMRKIDALFSTTSHLVYNGSELIQSDGLVVPGYLSIVYELQREDFPYQMQNVLDALCSYYVGQHVAFDVWFEKFPYKLGFKVVK